MKFSLGKAVAKVRQRVSAARKPKIEPSSNELRMQRQLAYMKRLDSGNPALARLKRDKISSSQRRRQHGK